MESKSESIIGQVFREFARLLLPLRALNSPQRITALFRDLGLDLPKTEIIDIDISSLTSSVDDLLDSIYQLEASSDQFEMLENSVNLVSTLKSLIDVIYGNDFKSKIENALSSYQEYFGDSNFINDFSNRMLDYLIIVYLQSFRPKLYGILRLLGIIENKDLLSESPESGEELVLREIHRDRLTKLISDPIGFAEDIYSWETSFNIDRLSSYLILLMSAYGIPGGFYKQDTNIISILNPSEEDSKELRIPIFQGGEWPDTYFEAGIAISKIPANSDANIGCAIIPYLIGETEITYDLGDNWQLILSGSVNLDEGIGLLIRPPKEIEILTNLFSSTSTSGSGSIEISLIRESEEGEQIILLGSPESSRLALSSISISLLGNQSSNMQELKIEFAISGLALIIDAKDGDGFIKKILPSGGIEASLDFTLGWSSIDGVYFSGSAGLEATIPIHKSIGPISFESLYLAMLPSENGDIPIHCAATINATLGPFFATVENIGLTTKISFPNGGGNLGPIDLSLGFKPPNGIGILIESGSVTGGGYLFIDHENRRYAGILQLEFKNIALKAIGLLTTRMPDGSEGFSLLICISAEFNPIQLGYGFTLNGVGGLLGVNRTMNVEALRSGLRNHALDSFLFPEDPIRDAQKIISDMRLVFPPKKDQYLFGPMGMIGWGGSVIKAEIGLIIELPSPLRVALVGQVYLILPDEKKAYVEIHSDILGVIEFEKKLFSIDATIYDSHLLAFTLMGDMAMRLKWGSNPNFALAVGGLHPQFQPPPGFPTLRRIQVSIGSGNNPRINLDMYTAMTANSVQFGAKLELYVKAGSATIQGDLGFDALFIISPFSFITNVRSGVCIKVMGHTLMGVSLDFTFSGPTPWNARGKAKVKFFGMKGEKKFNKTFGKRDIVQILLGNPWPVLEMAFKNDENWQGVPREKTDMLTSLRRVEREEGETEVDAEAYVLPMCKLEIKQKVLPLNLTLTQFGYAKPDTYNLFVIDNIKIYSNGIEINSFSAEDIQDITLKDYFAPAQFKEMSEVEKLSSPSYEEYDAGVVLFSDVVDSSHTVFTPIQYETIIIDKETGEGKRMETEEKITGKDIGKAKEAKEAKQEHGSPTEIIQQQLYSSVSGDTKSQNNVQFRKVAVKYGLPKKIAQALFNNNAPSRTKYHNKGTKKFGPRQVTPFANLKNVKFGIANTESLVINKELMDIRNGGLSYIEAHNKLDNYLKNNPQKKESWQVVPMEEVVQ